MGTFSYKLDRFLLTQHSFSVTLFTLGFRLFFIQLQINHLRFSILRIGRDIVRIVDFLSWIEDRKACWWEGFVLSALRIEKLVGGRVSYSLC